MSARLLVGVLLIWLLLAGCSDDEEAEQARAAAEEYVLAVERLSDDIYEGAQNALSALNRIADGTTTPDRAIGTLEASERTIKDAKRRLVGLEPPEAAAGAADDLEFQLDRLAFNVSFAAVDVRAGERGVIDLGDAGRNNARVILASQSGTSALSRALRELALESAG